MMRTVLLSAVLALPLAGCPAPSEVPEGEPEGPLPTDVRGGPPAVRSDSLDVARARWEDRAPAAYRMTLQRVCFCPMPDYTGPFEVTVRDGAIASVVLNGAEVEAERGMTVAALFDLVEEAYDRGAERVDVAYDVEWGVPTDVSIDYSTRMADEEIGYLVSDFEAL